MNNFFKSNKLYYIYIIADTKLVLSYRSNNERMDQFNFDNDKR